MNCKQGDLARVVHPQTEENRNRIVEVLQGLGHYERGAQFRLPDGGLGNVDIPGYQWWIRCPSGLVVLTRIGGHVRMERLTEGHIADSQLRPIRNPGDDAVDESHAWLPPVPTHTLEEA